VASFADAVIVGSAIMQRVEEACGDAGKLTSVAAFLHELGEAVHGASHRAGARGSL
jgi:tryptophan synthase alpha subunit